MKNNNVNNLFELLLEDVRYQMTQNEYIIDGGSLKKRINVNNILQELCIYIKRLTAGIELYKNVTVQIDYVALYDALRRYSRDVWGYKRMYTLLSNMPEISGAVLKKTVLEELRLSCFKVVSLDPYTYRKCAYLLYWLCKTHPFHLQFNKVNEHEFNSIFVSYNEMISFSLILNILKYNGYNVSIDKLIFQDITRDLHYRILDRTSLDLLLAALTKQYSS